ncbi:MAG: Zn-ribbon containing protein, partial [Halolamina sp.]
MPHQCTSCGRTFADGSKEMLSGCPDCGGNKFQFQPSGADTLDAADGAPKQEVEQEPPEPATAGAEEDTTPQAESSPEGREAGAEREMPESATDDDATDQFAQHGGETDDAASEENAAQRDARTASTTTEEIDAARRKMAETERFAGVPDDDETDDTSQRPNRGRGTPQGPPTDPPDEEETEQFGLSGAVGPPEDQPSSGGDQPSSGGPPGPEGASGQSGAEEDTLAGSDTDLSALREELNDQFESIKITAPGQYELNLMELYDRKEYIISLQEDGR